MSMDEMRVVSATTAARTVAVMTVILSLGTFEACPVVEANPPAPSQAESLEPERQPSACYRLWRGGEHEDDRAWVLVIAVVALATTALQSQQPQQPAPGTPTALPAVPAREPAWAFPVQGRAAAARSPEPKSVPGSTKKTPKEIDDLLNPPDWFPRRTQAGASIASSVMRGTRLRLVPSDVGARASRVERRHRINRGTSFSRCRTSSPARARTTRA